MPLALPDPLVPAEVDLHGYEFMPYYGDRLRDSDLNSRATDAEYRAAHNLWWSSWKQMPAASLPNDDVILCKLADLGHDKKAWQRVKARALHGFVLCNDGRYYHRILASLALESWALRVAAAAKGKAGAAKRWGKHKQPERMAQAPQNDGTGNATATKNDSKRERKEKTVKEEETPTASAHENFNGKPKVTTAGAWAIDLKRRGLEVTSMHPTLLAWIDDGFTLPQVIEAYETARKRIPEPARLGANYLDPILRNPPKAPQKSWWASESATLAKGRELGIEARPGEDMEAFRDRIRTSAHA